MMNHTYHSTYSNHMGHQTVIPSDTSNFLPHTYYISMVISELCTLERLEYRVNIDKISERVCHLINYIHTDPSLKTTLHEFFSCEESIFEILETMHDSGLLRIFGDYIIVNATQLDYIRDYLLDYY